MIQDINIIFVNDPTQGDALTSLEGLKEWTITEVKNYIRSSKYPENDKWTISYLVNSWWCAIYPGLHEVMSVVVFYSYISRTDLLHSRADAIFYNTPSDKLLKIDYTIHIQ